MNVIEARSLLESTHRFPCSYTFKVIGHAKAQFVDRALIAARAAVARELYIEHSSRHTPNGRHVAVTLLIVLESADEVLAVYRSLRGIEGLQMLL